jgi:hypothetical protein
MLVLDGAEIIRTTTYLKNNKTFQKIYKFDLQRYFNIEIMFNVWIRYLNFYIWNTDTKHTKKIYIL